MRTFHPDRHELHGMTVVVETDGPELWVGRCDDLAEDTLILLAADVHREGDGGLSRTQYLERAARLGVWAKYERVALPRARLTSIRLLGQP